MDLSNPEPLAGQSESGGEYQRFRYQLWSQAAQDFRSRPPASQRFASSGRYRAADEPRSHTGEPRGAPDLQSRSESGSAPPAEPSAAGGRPAGQRVIGA